MRANAMRHIAAFLALLIVTVSPKSLLSQHDHASHGETPKEGKRVRAPETLPKVPPPDAQAAFVPSGYRVEIVARDLTYPTSIEVDDAGRVYVAEGGFIYGDDIAPARILRLTRQGDWETIADDLNGPVTDLLWHAGRLYISHRGKISVLEGKEVRDLVTGLPSLGDHHNNQMTIGPDGKLYFGQGTATNSGVVGVDNLKMGWPARFPEVHDIPAKDIRVTDQAFKGPDLLVLLASDGGGRSTSPNHESHKQGHANHDHAGHAASSQNSKQAKKNSGHAGHGKESSVGRASAPAKHEERHTKTPAPPDHSKHSTGEHSSDHSQQHADHAAHDHPASDEIAMLKTYAFGPFGKTPPDNGAIRGEVKANGTILRMNLDGSGLEVFAWGLRNPFGVMWGPDQRLYASDNGYDERGSRPIAHAPDCVWEIKEDAWYGFPDYAAGTPVTDARFRPEHGPAPKFLLRDHPMVEQPLVELTHHVAAAKLAFSTSADFGFKGQMFLALAGDMNPITGEHEKRSGFEVVRIDLNKGEPETFFKAKKSALGPKGMEYVATAGPRRPVDVHFSRDGNALYVVDVGSMAIIPTAAGPTPRPFPRTGVVWRITRDK